jgi:hypothetical protein
MNVYPLTVYKGRVFSVELDYLFLPNGREFHVAIVRHSPSVVIIPIEDDGRIVLIKTVPACLEARSMGNSGWEHGRGRVAGGGRGA